MATGSASGFVIAVHVCIARGRTMEQETVMAEEVVNLWLCTVCEYAFTFMQYQFAYPLRFASLLFDDDEFPVRLRETREHYSLVLKYERIALTNMAVREFLNGIGFICKPSVRTSWILWSAAPDSALGFAEQDPRAQEMNSARFGGLGEIAQTIYSAINIILPNSTYIYMIIECTIN